MSYPQFKYLNPTTMTLVSEHNVTLNRGIVFTLLHVDRQKITGPVYDSAGNPKPLIVTLEYNGDSRGVNVNENKINYLKNSIAIKLYTDKLIDIKLSEIKAQMVGVQNTEQAFQANIYLIDLITNIQKNLDHMRKDIIGKKNAHDYFIGNSVGTITKKPIYENYTYIFYDPTIVDKKKYKKNKNIFNGYSDDSVFVLQTLDEYFEEDQSNIEDSSTANSENEDNDFITVNNNNISKVSLKGGKYEKETKGIYKTKREIKEMIEKATSFTVKYDDYCIFSYNKIVSYVDDNVTVIPPRGNIDKKIYSFIANALEDYKYYSDAKDFFDWVFTMTENVYDTSPKIVSIRKSMVNYNYDIGMFINRIKLCSAINAENEGFRCNYDNLSSHTITVTLPHEVDEINICRKKNKNKVNFMVYYSGKVTQSGSSEEINEWAFNKFFKIISKYRNDIILQLPRKYKISSHSNYDYNSNRSKSHDERADKIKKMKDYVNSRRKEIMYVDDKK